MFYRFIFLVIMMTSSPAIAADHQIDGVPLPANIEIVSPENGDDANRQWLGAWIGAWGNTLKHILVVQSVAEDGKADIVYAIGDNPLMAIEQSWSRYEAMVSGDILPLTGPGLSISYHLNTDGKLKAKYARGNSRAVAIMTKVDLAAILKSEAKLDWTNGKSELIATDLVEGGKPVHLEVVTFKPSGPGPFPLMVFNHGSTGSGTDTAMFTHTWSDLGLATFFNERGWMVAFPQRRGRGKSDGLYDEGFSNDRSRGYTCEADISLAGAARALEDIDAAITALQRLPDVAQSPVLIGGQSRGGVLAIAYAGLHPEKVVGVVNFVGGWMGELCSSASQINETLFKKGAGFDHASIWLYGHGDPFYSIEHSRMNFEAFQKSGGQGEFFDFKVPGDYGHYVWAYEELWSDPMEKYLRLLAN